MESTSAAVPRLSSLTGEQLAVPFMDPVVTSAKSIHGQNTKLPRSASCDQISVARVPNKSYEPHKIKRTLSQNALPGLYKEVSRASQKSLGKSKGFSKKTSTSSDSKPRIAISKYTLATQYDHSSSGSPQTSETDSVVRFDQKSPSVLGSRFARKSWSTTSRSPSPRKVLVPVEGAALIAQDRDFGIPSSSTPKHESHQIVKKPGERSPSDTGMKGSTAKKKPKRPLSTFLGRGPSEKKVALIPLIPKSFSLERLPSISQAHSTGVLPTIPKSISSDRLQSLGLESPRRRDELWGAFRALDGDFNKFQSRSNVSKTAVVRSALLPFLKTYADHPSINLIKLEELDRRVHVLNRWWKGLLEMLNGRNGESVSGNDRPTILDAAAAIMVRPEWDLSSSHLVTHLTRNPKSSLKSQSTASLTSTAPEILAESVFHNIKNTFAQNLLAQMSYVVDKMSTRNVPISVVTFCGKAIAYAFLYCDGVAEILVRLWATSSQTIRRVLAEYGVRRDTDLKSASEKIISRFPPCVHTLSFTSLQSMMRHLRRRPQLPVGTGYIRWHGSWVGRWAGRDTDLFFVFTKSYYNLACRLLPETHSQTERLCAPGHALIQAQILTILDTTMQHTSGQPSVDHFKESSLMTFDDILSETDASANLLPIPTSSIVRSMAENRLIMLLRECLSGSCTMTEHGREAFACSFQTLLKAAARRISMFDHNACFTLCDFMEEVIIIMARYHQPSDSLNVALDWPFWFEVWRKLMESQNTMTEIRFYAFLYSLWGTLTSDEGRKREICLAWLLQEGNFQRQFSHWCPMVRAYFMRLLCWRIARVDGTGSELDRKILKTLAVRLKRGWCHYLYLKEYSEREKSLAPSTAPCNPAPGRSLLIVRDDLQTTSSGMFLSFDSLLSSSSQATAYERHSSLYSISQTSSPRPSRTNDDRGRVANVGKRRWGLLKNMIPFTSVPSDRPPPQPLVTNPLVGKESLWSAISHRTQIRAESRLDRSNKKSFILDSEQSHRNAAYKRHSFKFSLEWIDKNINVVERERQIHSPRLPITVQMSSQTLQDDAPTLKPCEPVGDALGPSKYIGRALAEWSDIIKECQDFFEKRRNEGVPTSFMVETPTLGVESIRKYKQ